MFKKILFLTAVFVLGLGLSTNVNTSAAANNPSKDLSFKAEKELYVKELSNLSSEEVIENFQRIDKQYDIGEVFSLKDQTFIEMYAIKTSPSEIGTFNVVNQPVKKTMMVDGITIIVDGTIFHNISGKLLQNFGASQLKTATTSRVDRVTSVVTKVHHNAFGAIGSEGLGKVYDDIVSTSGKNSTLHATKNYTAIVAYAYTWYQVTVKHTGGTFTVQ